MNLLRSQSISGLCDRHGSAILLALDGHARNRGLAERFGAPPNGPVWTSVPFRCRWSSQTKRSRGPHTRPIRILKYVRKGYFRTVTPRFWSSTQPPMPGWPNGATFSHVCSFGRLAPLLDTPQVFNGVVIACLNVSRLHALQKGACCTTLLDNDMSILSSTQITFWSLWGAWRLRTEIALLSVP